MLDLILLEKIERAFEIGIVLMKDGKKTAQFPEESQFSSIFEKNPFFFSKEELDTMPDVFICMEDYEYSYGVIRLKKGENLIIGPIFRTHNQTKGERKYRHRHQLKESAMVNEKSLNEMAEIMKLIAYVVCGKQLEEIEIVNHYDAISVWEPEAYMEKHQLLESENEHDHRLAMEFENEIMEIVENGDMERVARLARNASKAKYKNVYYEANPGKHIEYMALSMITLLTRAAIRGGMNAENAHSLGDIYVQKLSQCKKPEEMLALANRAQYEFTEQVKKEKEKANKVYCIEQCKDYIAKNLRKPLKVNDIALALGFSRSYLAHRFSEAEGITIQKYIMKERCEHAANLLRFSDYPISIISEYFCFSSQSHFGKQFMIYYGMTPKEYRNKNRNLQQFF